VAAHRATPANRIPVITRTQDIPELPLNRYGLSVAQNTTIYTALRLGARACMTKYGFPDFHGADLYEGLTWSLQLGARDFTMINADDAAKYGYHVTPPSWTGGNDDTPHGAGINPVTQPTAPSGDSALATAIYHGDNAGTVVHGIPVPPGGCQASAENAINTYVPYGAAYELSQAIGWQAWARAREDRRVKAAFAAWSRCMASAGFVYNAPDDLYDVPKVGYWNSATVTSTEIADATANVRCKSRTNVVGIWWAATAEIEQRLLRANPGYFAAVDHYTAAMVARCSEIVAAGHPVGDALALTPPTVPLSISDLLGSHEPG
jgi:hypothetical protein